MIAALPMYDRAETSAANDRFWALIRDGLRARGMSAPDNLRRGDAELLPQWESPDLVLSQTCGFPYRAKLHGRVSLIGTPDYGVEGCLPGYYRSVFVARANDPRDTLTEFDGASLAYNDPMSQSGWAAPQNHATSLGLTLHPGVQSGGHKLSMMAVVNGQADIAALDAVTWSLLAEWEPAAQQVKVVGMTEPTPGLPYIAAANADSDALFSTITAAIAALSDEDRRILRLRGLIRIPPEAYLSVPTPPTPSHFAQKK
jgi:ABC-type phosphate/phosphonate transport system substrate-binding protein